MSNIHQPPKVGFPGAYSSTPYQPVPQFNQYQGVTQQQYAAPQNGYPQTQYSTNGPQTPTHFPQPGAPVPQFQQQQPAQHFPNQPPAFPSAFKPIEQQPSSSLANGGFPQLQQPKAVTPSLPPAPMMHPAPPLPQQPSLSQQQSFPAPIINGPRAPMAPMPGIPPARVPAAPVPTRATPPGPQMPPAPPAPIVSAPPAPPSFPTMHTTAPTPTMAPSFPAPATSVAAPSYPQPQGFPGGQAYGGAPQQQPQYGGAPPQQQPQFGGAPVQQQPQYGAQQQPQYGGGGYPNASLQQSFGQMNVSGQYQPSGYGQLGDVVDLLNYKNVVGDFPDVPIAINTHMANNEARVDPNIFRSTLNAVPCNEEILKKSRLPFGLTLHPFRDMKNLNIIQTSTIVRCRYCRTYINPFVTIPDMRHWKCNLCNRNNDLPDDFCWDPSTKSYGDPKNRPEIRHATVEFIAPSEYMLRPPQPAVYVFLIDVSAAAIECGYLYALMEQILINLDQLPGDDRTQVAFIGVDACVHFFQFEADCPPRQMVVDDVDDIYLPTNSGLLVNLKKNKETVRNFLQQLPTIFEKPTSSHNCLGAALTAAKEMIMDVGGRVSVFQCTIPDLGPGALKPREDPNQRASTEVQNLGPATDFYKRLSLECTGQQIAMDLFAFNTQYLDLASLSEIAKFSTGCIYHFPNYKCFDIYQVKRFEKTFTRYLTRKIGFEAVLRIRCSRGLALSAFYGNFFVRSTDLLALANVNPDSALAVQVNMEEKLGSTVVFQAALLYTSSKGDRRIRVHTLCLPTTNDLTEVYNNFDLKATVSLLCKIGVERSMSGSPLSDSREAIVNAVVDTLCAYKKTVGQGRGALPVPFKSQLRHFPVFALAMLKHTALCSGGRSIKLDERVAAMLTWRFCPLEQILSELYPKLYRLNDIAKLAEDEFPSPLPLSFEHIHRDGVYVMEAGSALFVYVSSGADPNFLMEVFGCSYNDVEKSTLEERGNPTSEKVLAFLKNITTLKFYLGPAIIIKEDSPLREHFVRRLVEDRTESTHSYIEFLQHIKREMSS